MASSTSLQWEVQEDGYQVLKAGPPTYSHVLTSKFKPGNIIEQQDASGRVSLLITLPAVRLYDPMTHRGLFRRFAKLPISKRSVLRFADKYGLLGLTDLYDGESESVEDWYLQIASLRFLVELYDITGGRDITPLHEHVCFGEEGFTVKTVNLVSVLRRSDVRSESTYWEPEWEMTCYNYNPNVVPGRFAPPSVHGNALEAALHHVRTCINRELRDAAVIALVADSERSGETGIAYTPRSLHAALWLQFALQVAEMRKRVPHCQNCGKPFWLKRSGQKGRERAQRSDSKYCCHSCKVAGYRKRKKAAQDDSQAAQ